jgi:hypothetical protein
MLFPAYWRDDQPPDWYVIGVNYPGIPESGRGGYHLGPNQVMGHDVNLVTPHTLTTLQEDFTRLRNMGCSVVRMWAFTQGQGLRWNNTRNGTILAGLDRDFRDNVRNITACAARERLKIYWTLFNGSDFIVDPEQEARIVNMKTAFHNILTDHSGGRYRFPLINLVLPEFVRAIRDNLDGVFAIDLMNEPDTYWLEAIEGDLRDLYRYDSGRITHTLLRTYLDRRSIERSHYDSLFRECNQLIGSWSEPPIPVSVGFCRFHSVRMGAFPYLSFYDYHHYNHFDPAYSGFLPLPDWDSLGHRMPCIIGECGLGGQFMEQFESASFAVAYRHVASRSRNVTPVTFQELFDAQALCIKNVISESYHRGYGGCLFWEYGKQYTDALRATSPYRPRRLDDPADWGDRHHLIWHPTRGSRYPQQYAVPLTPVDQRVTGRKAVDEIQDLSETYRNSCLCPPI